MTIFIYTTFPNKILAEKISSSLLEKKLIACSNIFENVSSLYFWKSKVERSKECVAFLKTQKSLFSKVKEEIIAQHEYECPCVLSFSVDEIHKEFGLWIQENTKN